jgi:hypothetical protein
MVPSYLIRVSICFVLSDTPECDVGQQFRFGTRANGSTISNGELAHVWFRVGMIRPAHSAMLPDLDSAARSIPMG